MAKSAFVPTCDASDIGMLRFILRALFNRDCDGLGKRLMERFGSLFGIFDATAEELTCVSGMTERAAAFFAFARPAFRQALLREEAPARLCGETELARYAVAFFMNKRLPCDYCLLLDDAYTLTRAHRLVEYDRTRDLVGCACRYRARRVVWLCHKPFATRLAPNAERIDAIISAARSLDGLGIELTEYLEYSPFRFFGLRRATEYGDCRAADLADARVCAYDGGLSPDGLAEYKRLRAAAVSRAYLGRGQARR